MLTYRTEVFRKRRADGETFITEHTRPHEPLRSFVIRVKRDGEAAMLAPPTVLHHGPRFQMVGDRQNTLPDNDQPDGWATIT